MIFLLSLTDAPLTIRSQFAPSRYRIPALLKKIPFSAVIVTTCNRTEIFLSIPDEQTFSRNQLLRMIEAPPATKKYFKISRGAVAVRKLFLLSAGLRSPIPGENQVLAQTREAYRIAADSSACDQILHRLFQRAFTVGKAVRSQTEINRGNLGIGSAAVELARQKIPQLTQQKILLAGLGETNTLVLKFLAKLRSTPRLSVGQQVRLQVFTRRWRKIESLAKKYGAAAHPFAEISAELPTADIFFTATAAPQPIFSNRFFRQREKPLLIIDLAVPSDCRESVARLPAIRYFNVDAVQRRIAQNLKKRTREKTHAKRIVADAVIDFCARFIQSDA